MAGKALKASEKKVLKYSRDGAVEQNLVQGTETRISGRTEDAVLKADTPAEELYGKDHREAPETETPKHHKPRFIQEQQDGGSKLQADYATHRTETPLTFENVPKTENTPVTAPVNSGTPAVPQTENAEIKQTVVIKRDDEAPEPEPEYQSELSEDWRSESVDTGTPATTNSGNFEFRKAPIVPETGGKKGSHKKFRIENEPDAPENAADGDDEQFSRHSVDDFNFRDDTPAAVSDQAQPPQENKRRNKPKLRDERNEGASQAESEQSTENAENADNQLFPRHSDDNFSFREAGETPEQRETSDRPKHRKRPKFRAEQGGDTTAPAVAVPEDNQQFPRHEADDFSFRDEAPVSEQSQPEGNNRHNSPQIRNEPAEDAAENGEPLRDSADIPRDEPVFREDKTRKTLQQQSSFAEKLSEKRSRKKEKTEKLKRKQRRKLSDKDSRKEEAHSESTVKVDGKTVSAESSDGFIRPSTEEIPLTRKEKRADRQIRRYEKRSERAERKVEKDQKKVEKAERKLPQERVIRKEKVVSEKTGKPKRRLKFEKQAKSSDKPANPVVSGTKNIVSGAVSYGVNTVKNEFRKYEEENPALKALDGTVQVGESALRFSRKEFQKGAERLKQMPYKKVSKLKFQAENTEKKLSMQRNKQQIAEANKKKAQRQAVKKAQQKQARKKAQKTAKSAAKKAEEATEKLVQGVIKTLSNPIVLLVIVIIAAIIVLIFCICSLFGSIGSTSAPMALLSSYTAEDNDMHSADGYLTGLEDNLRQQIESIPENYPDFNEYRYDIAPIGHDPYALTSYLSAIDPMFTADSAKGDIDRLFNSLYNLSLSEIEEKRKITVSYTDEEGNPQTKEVEITVKILQVTLTAKDFDSTVRSLLTADQYEMYQVLLSTQGNRPDLFA